VTRPARAASSRSDRTPGPRTGRPRLTPRAEVSAQVIDEILTAASTLFGQHSVANTTMAAIARDSGLQQSSLYYYFRSKEEVLAALVARANIVPLALAERIADDGGSGAVQLYRFVSGDVRALCQLPFDINEVHRHAARDRPRFEQYWLERRTLKRRVSTMLRAGIADGTVRTVDIGLTALTIISNDEAVQNWYRVERAGVSPDTIATALADLVVGGLLAPRRRLDTVRAAARRLDVASAQ
jgi:TetR/AcrR family transcriptional regulator